MKKRIFVFGIALGIVALFSSGLFINTEKAEATGSHVCYDAYTTGGTWVVLKCITCTQVAHVKNVANQNSCGGNNNT